MKTPEQLGISSRDVLAFYKELDARCLSTHSVILSRGDEFFSECYYTPFHKDFLHRIYSSSKSFVSVAIGFCEQDGLLNLDDPFSKFFPEYPAIHTGTIRQMLQMETTLDNSGGWFVSGTNDRTSFYFTKQPQKLPGTLFRYDSSASYMLGVIVERLTGKPFLKYLQEKVLDEIGFSKDAYCLQCPGGNSWGDSGIMCTARDLWLFARFVLNKGTWNGKRYLNEEYLTQATKCDAVTNAYGFFNMHGTQGYGYQFWGATNGCFATKGMGNQFAICDPIHDVIMVINSDNQGNDLGYEYIHQAFFRNIFDRIGDPLPEDAQAKVELDEYIASRKLFVLPESKTASISAEINGKTFECSENAAGIKWFRLDFASEEGTFTYENATGEKAMTFGFGHNVFHKFPEAGYSDMVGTIGVPGHRYDAAFSADWPNEKTLRIRVQIIDKYFGNLGILFGFQNAETVTLRMEKTAEAFLNEYTGLITAKAK